MKWSRTTMTSCQQSHTCDDYLPTLRKALDKIEQGLGPKGTANSEGFCDVAHTCGPVWWASLTAAADAIGCSHCRPEALKMVSALHDVKNVLAGKAIYNPGNFEWFAGLVAFASAKVGAAAAKPKHPGQIPSVKRFLRSSVDFAHLPRTHEIGAAICQAPGGALSLGPWVKGEALSVRVPLSCAGGGKALGIAHSHPADAEDRLSPLDRASAKKAGAINCALHSVTGSIKCAGPKG
jgi:hypothetical protein